MDTLVPSEAPSRSPFQLWQEFERGKGSRRLNSMQDVQRKINGDGRESYRVTAPQGARERLPWEWMDTQDSESEEEVMLSLESDDALSVSQVQALGAAEYLNGADVRSTRQRRPSVTKRRLSHKLKALSHDAKDKNTVMLRMVEAELEDELRCIETRVDSLELEELTTSFPQLQPVVIAALLEAMDGDRERVTGYLLMKGWTNVKLPSDAYSEGHRSFSTLTLRGSLRVSQAELAKKKKRWRWRGRKTIKGFFGDSSAYHDL